jgi:hypothetical protein
MPSATRFSRVLPLASALCLAVPAYADSLYHDQVHADSFGNLVIYSSAGYKRIVVGKGHLAPEFAGLYDDRAERYEEPAARRACNRQPVLLHGRSYMYGLPDNVVPVPAGLCP